LSAVIALGSGVVDVDELINNIRGARDLAEADRDAFKRERDALDPQDVAELSKRLELTMDIIASDTVAAALSRILGETRKRPGESSTS
jgi:hypothetical protein